MGSADRVLRIVLAAIVGYAGLASTINAINYKKTIALANKETLESFRQIETGESESYTLDEFKNVLKELGKK